jgi:hypothetical protein
MAHQGFGAGFEAGEGGQEFRIPAMLPKALSILRILSILRMLTPTNPWAFGKFRVGRFDPMALSVS